MGLNRSITFLAGEKITFLYIFLTSVIIIHLIPRVQTAYELLGNRMLFIVIMIVLAYLSSIKDWWFIRLSRYAFLGALLAYWYPETFDINRMILNYDYLLASWEQSFFGCQPAILFAKIYPQKWFSELLYMGYLSYYPLIICSSLYFFFKDRNYFKYFFFTLLFSFFVYYLIYILFPTAGPQYYFQAIGQEQVNTGIFPNLGYYFNEHSRLLTNNESSGYFCDVVRSTQQLGERPTAAFPSSHVGISSIIMILKFKNRRYFLLTWMFPIYTLLVLGTVYIQAHYVIDVIAGLISAIAFYYSSVYVFHFFSKSFQKIFAFTVIFIKQPLKKQIK